MSFRDLFFQQIEPGGSGGNLGIGKGRDTGAQFALGVQFCHRVFASGQTDGLVAPEMGVEHHVTAVGKKFIVGVSSRRNLAAFLRLRTACRGSCGKSRMKHPVGIILANLLQIKENRKLKFILPMVYYVDGV